jgi:23S rRNA (pseudouridine1915-N3)-methyltransferase
MHMMGITICAVGRLRQKPEAVLVSNYVDRFNKLGRKLGFGLANLIEVEDKNGSGISAEAILLEKAIPKKSIICVLDENGKTLTSPNLASFLANCRDNSKNNVTFLIGGADGIEKSLKKKADYALSFGKMVWPHSLARVMLAEQIYRSATIPLKTPYHRN